MPSKRIKVSLVYFVIFTLLLVGLVPLVLTGWFLSERSGSELRAVENRYQIQLVQEKARQIDMFGQRHGDLVKGLANGFALSANNDVFMLPQTDVELEATLRENPDVIALYVSPVGAEPLALYRPGNIARQDIDRVVAGVLEKLHDQPLYIEQPQIVGESKESVLTLASPIVSNGVRRGSVISIVSLAEIARNVVGMDPTFEAELWASGLPIIYVVDEEGRAVFHPDPTLVRERISLSGLRIVEEWMQSNSQIQSGLVPFTAEVDGNAHDMIGAYSTANLAGQASFGVITMQDESRALASVGEMRMQTWMISLAFALLALIVGAIAARSLTSPIVKLSGAAERIAGGDLSTRVETANITEIGTLGESFNTMSDRLEEHIAKLAHAARENRELFVGTVKALAAAIDGKDKYTRGHSERVARISVAIGKQMNLPEEELEALRISALLHDIGKIAIDDNILKKPAALTPEEYEIMKTHPVKGYKIMSQIPAMKDFLPGMYMHHEMVNGEGYPQGLKDEEIPIQAKIVSVADTFDAMTIDRPYSKGMLLDDALLRIREYIGIRYDGEVVEALERGCRTGDIGRGVVQSIANASKGAENNVNLGVARDLKQNQDEGALLDIPNVQQPVGGLPADSKPIVL
jgi:HD-GYP domain-containing protein (c-di-GMP phosphodiesterase class II)